MADALDIDGIPLDDLLPPPSNRVKRKEPNHVLDAENQLISGMATALQPTNKGACSHHSFFFLCLSTPFIS